MRPTQTQLLRKYGIRPKKRLGQHFLLDNHILDRIVRAVLELAPRHAVELGAGMGALTAPLIDAGLEVDALELDPPLAAALRAELPSARVHQVDLARTDLAEFVGEEPMVFVGNLPYQVTSVVLFALIPLLRQEQVRGAILMMQAEVAARLVASPGGKDYGVLAVLVGAELCVERVTSVRPGSFLPPPAVDSAVVRLTFRQGATPLPDSAIHLVKTLFGERRKQIGGLLRRHFGLNGSQVGELEDELSLAPSRRAETMTLADFQGLDRWLQRNTGDTHPS